MERLTSCDMYFDDVDKRLFYAKLKQYEDAEEQGLLLRLPFKIGQKVYYIYESCIGESKSFMIGSMVYSYFCLDFPRNYFETKEEAEQALKRMESE